MIARVCSGQIELDFKLLEGLAVNRCEICRSTPGQVAAKERKPALGACGCAWREDEIQSRAGRNREPVNVLGAASVGQVVQPNVEWSVGWRDEIERRSATIRRQLARALIEHGDYRREARVNFWRETFDKQPLTFLRRETKVTVRCRGHSTIEDRVDRQSHGCLRFCILLLFYQLRQISDCERTGIRHAGTARDTPIINSQRPLA